MATWQHDADLTYGRLGVDQRSAHTTSHAERLAVALLLLLTLAWVGYALLHGVDAPCRRTTPDQRDRAAACQELRR